MQIQIILSKQIVEVQHLINRPFCRQLNIILEQVIHLDKNGRGYKLSGDLVQGTIAQDKVGYYTCFNTNKDATCQRLFYTVKYNSSTSMTVRVSDMERPQKNKHKVMI